MTAARHQRATGLGWAPLALLLGLWKLSGRALWSCKKLDAQPSLLLARAVASCPAASCEPRCSERGGSRCSCVLTIGGRCLGGQPDHLQRRQSESSHAVTYELFFSVLLETTLFSWDYINFTSITLLVFGGPCVSCYPKCKNEKSLPTVLAAWDCEAESCVPFTYMVLQFICKFLELLQGERRKGTVSQMKWEESSH